MLPCPKKQSNKHSKINKQNTFIFTNPTLKENWKIAQVNAVKIIIGMLVYLYDISLTNGCNINWHGYYLPYLPNPSNFLFVDSRPLCLMLVGCSELLDLVSLACLAVR